jgi:hypothetical protein
MLTTTARSTLAGLTLVLLPALALAQTTPAPAPRHVPMQKTIGQARPEVVPSLIVMNAGGATLDGTTLTLTSIAPNSIVFADRPVRAAGHSMTATLLDEWNHGDSFANDPPNATISVFGATEDEIRDAVVVLKSPKLDGTTLTFQVDVLDGSIDGATGPAAIFIDIIGRPLTPGSFAGVARRTGARAAWYGAGAVAAGAAVAATAPYAYAPAGYAAPPTCGYYPYLPCYP